MKGLTAALIAVQQHADQLRGAPGKDGKDGRSGKATAAPGLVWRGAWVSQTRYDPGEVVESEGSAYICTAVTAAKPPGEGWDLLAAKGQDSGPVYVPRGGGSSGGSLTVKDEGVALDTAVTSVDFAGAGVTATAVGHAVTVTVGGGGSTPTLAEVLVAGNDVGGTAIVSAANGAGTGATILVNPAPNATTGGDILVAGGDSTSDAALAGQVQVSSGNRAGETAAVDGASVILSGAALVGGTIYLRSGGYWTAPAENDGAEIELRGADATNPGLVFLNLPTSDPGVAGALWNNAGVVMVSSG